MPKGYPIDLSNGKFCPRCKVTKPCAEFSESKHSVHGLQSYCKLCMSARHDEYRRKNLKEIAIKQRERYAANKDRYRGYELKNHYGISLDQYADLLKKQKGVCLICKTTNPNGKGSRFHVDHYHSSKKVRGLLCTNCNIGLGHFKHSMKLLNSAIYYLSETS